MNCLLSWCLLVGGFIVAMIIAAIVTRLVYAVNKDISRAPALDLFVGFFTWMPWIVGAWFWGWAGFAASVVAEFLMLHIFCLTDRAIRGKSEPTLMDTHSKLLGFFQNQIALFATLPAFFVFALVRFAEVFCYPLVGGFAKFPKYNHSEWVAVSRHKFQGLIGYDLVWCWYCDWMTGVWSLGSEMLRNVESFWCPIRFESPAKVSNTATDFPDVREWVPADATLKDAVKAVEEKYAGRSEFSWWGHPSRAAQDKEK